MNTVDYQFKDVKKQILNSIMSEKDSSITNKNILIDSVTFPTLRLNYNEEEDKSVLVAKFFMNYRLILLTDNADCIETYQQIDGHIHVNLKGNIEFLDNKQKEYAQAYLKFTKEFELAIAEINAEKEQTIIFDKKRLTKGLMKKLKVSNDVINSIYTNNTYEVIKNESHNSKDKFSERMANTTVSESLGWYFEPNEKFSISQIQSGDMNETFLISENGKLYLMDSLDNIRILFNPKIHDMELFKATAVENNFVHMYPFILATQNKSFKAFKYKFVSKQKRIINWLKYI